jgi:hypothetical protein
MPEVATKPADVAMTWTRDNPPPEDVTVRVAYAAAPPRTFHFRRTLLAYDHYVKALYDSPEGPGPIAVATTFLIDTVAADERDDLAAFLATDAGQALVLSLYRVANALLDIYNGTLTVEFEQPGASA